jgi:hypothetical protein
MVGLDINGAIIRLAFVEALTGLGIVMAIWLGVLAVRAMWRGD